MPMVCTICKRPDCPEIDKALISGTSIRGIAGQFPGVTKSAVDRHRQHLPAQVVQAAAEEAARQAIDVIEQLRAINGASLQILREARVAKDGLLALNAIDRIQKQITLQARLLAEIKDQPVVNILLLPEWQQLRTVLLTALRPFPAAAEAAAKALSSLGGVNAGE